MIINFNGDISKQEVQEIINSALTKYQRIVNISTASAEELISAVTIPDYCILSFNYQDKTYFEQFREETDSGTTVTVFFYVMAALPSDNHNSIYDKIYRRKINKTTGASTNVSNNVEFVPGISYDMANMNNAQKSELAHRVLHNNMLSNDNFTAKWAYEEKMFTRCGSAYNRTQGMVGICEDWDEGRIYLDILSIEYLASTDTYIFKHKLVYLDATFTPVQ